MYLEHFNFRVNPFTLKTDPQFLWVGPNQRQALATLAYGLQENRGIVVLGGEFGTGKTTLINQFVSTLADDVSVALLPEPGNNPEELHQAIAGGFGIQESPQSREDLTAGLRRLAGDHEGRKRRLLLIIDEAQRLTIEMLEEVFRLAQIDYEGSRLIHILLAGQTEVYQWLTGTRLATFIDEVSATCNLHSLSAQETAAYIDHRLKTAGAACMPFAQDAVDAIHTVSHGIPRTINLACDFALLRAQLKGCDQVDAEMVLGFADRLQIAKIADTRGTAVAVRETAPPPALPDAISPPEKRSSRQIWVPLLLLLLIVGGILYYNGYRPNPAPQQEKQAPAPRAEPAPARPRLREMQSALVPGPAGREAPAPAIPRPPGNGPSEAGGRSQVKTAPKPPEKSKENRSAAAPGMAAEPPAGKDRSAEPPPKKTEPPNPSPPVEVRLAGPATARSEVAEKPARPAFADDARNEPDPGEIIDWLMQAKDKEREKSPPPGGGPN